MVLAENDYNTARVRRANDRPFRESGKYVLYWTQIYRRLDHNHALNYALACAEHFRRPLVVYEGLKLGYPWASRRLHQFILEGMLENRAAAARLGLTYWPFVETPADAGRGLLRKLAADAVAVVTDDFPCFIIPGQTDALAAGTDTPVVAVDGNGLVPLALLGGPVKMAAHLRPRLHRAFAEAWGHRAGQPRVGRHARGEVEPPFDVWTVDADGLPRFVESLPLDASVPPVEGRPGGTGAARRDLTDFLGRKLSRYADGRSNPMPPDRTPASRLSPYLHLGHIAAEEVVEKALATTGDWSPDRLAARAAGKRDGFFCDDANVNAFLDEIVTWRDVGFHWHWHRRGDTANLDKALPTWALESLRKHASDSREHVYTPEELEAGGTHDELWNAAQRELVATGSIHNYMRMLWGKKVVQWSPDIDTAYRTLVHLNNKYALDGRNPNSYSGILWCFGLFDRPWPPERPVFGNVRYMSSDSARKKFQMGPYLDWVATLPTIAAVRG